MVAQAEKRDALNRLNHVNLIEQEKKQAESSKMKAFFQKSGIYKKYVDEKNLEQEEDKVFVSTTEEINRMKSKMNELHQKYDKLQSLVHKQDQDAVTLQQLIRGQVPAAANVTTASQQTPIVNATANGGFSASIPMPAMSGSGTPRPIAATKPRTKNPLQYFYSQEHEEQTPVNNATVVAQQAPAAVNATVPGFARQAPVANVTATSQQTPVANATTTGFARQTPVVNATATAQQAPVNNITTSAAQKTMNKKYKFDGPVSFAQTTQDPKANVTATAQQAPVANVTATAQ